VIQAHAETFLANGIPVTVIAGRGEETALPPGSGLILIPEIDSQHAEIVQMSTSLEQGLVPPRFENMVDLLVEILAPILSQFESLLVHNVFTKHFNLPLTAALHRLLDEGEIPNCIAWCHDFTWTSPSSRSRVHPGYPWDLLRTYRPDLAYVVVSKERQRDLAELFGCDLDKVRVVYNGVDPGMLLGLSDRGRALVQRLGLFSCDLVLLMPVRVTHAKNIEYALHTVAALKDRGCRPKLILTGPPDPHDASSMAYFRELQTLRRDLGVDQEMRFIFEEGDDPAQGLIIDTDVVGDLFRVSDLMFMPSHREGFAMPVLEAGLVGMPVVSTAVPAAVEIGGEDVLLFDENEDPAGLAEQILAWAEGSRVHQLRRRVRQNYTWQAIFSREIKPLLAKTGTPHD
jgi:glycosyltransferase involved in cell wall biosynthesis